MLQTSEFYIKLWNRRYSDLQDLLSDCSCQYRYVGTCCYRRQRAWSVGQKRNLMAHAQKLDLVFQRNGRVHLYRRGCQFSRLLAAEVCGSAVVMLDRPCPIQCTTVLATPSIRLFPLHFSTHAFPCAIRFRFCSTYNDLILTGNFLLMSSEHVYQ